MGIIIDEDYMVPGKLYKTLIDQYGHLKSAKLIPVNTFLIFLYKCTNNIGGTNHVFLYNSKLLTIKYHTQVKGDYTSTKNRFCLIA